MTLEDAIRIVLDRIPEEDLQGDALLDDAVHYIRVTFEV